MDTMPSQAHEPPSPAVLRRASSAPEMERKLRTALAIEHQRRVVAEGRAEQIASLSPVEQAMLAAWARTARLLHAPKPRCLCCGGPLFWMCIVPWLLCVAFYGRLAARPHRAGAAGRGGYADATRAGGGTLARARPADAQKARPDRAGHDEHRPRGVARHRLLQGRAPTAVVEF